MLRLPELESPLRTSAAQHGEIGEGALAQSSWETSFVVFACELAGVPGPPKPKRSFTVTTPRFSEADSSAADLYDGSSLRRRRFPLLDFFVGKCKATFPPAHATCCCLVSELPPLGESCTASTPSRRGEACDDAFSERDASVEAVEVEKASPFANAAKNASCPCTSR